ncbi:hypothetical protein Zmor_009384 [Zophobas morio]|uniref:Integrin alpha-PS2 n=1 Tax=Zophobas morio TaxID=2755281 RepID=A0AA38INW1_9CUCU|nr:hypothetical protein Zmor_009384 [Zophobas morio]
MQPTNLLPGQVHQQSLETRPAVFSTTEGTERDDDSYMGYSTITGDFLGNGQEGIAVGMPRGNDLKGKVLLFTWNLTNFLHHFTSDQIGSYYGYALAASDVDGDGKLDLIVGSPMYTVQNNKDKYDVGRVYVIYHQSEKGKFMANYIIDGFNSKSRFGQALASLGDINQDGFGDFAVGAPYDGKENRGAVYIYHGSSKGVRKKFSQVIFAEDVIPLPTGALTTFGFSITGGLDLDGNQYPDMAVGAYLSNKAFFFRSRPVIKVEASVKFLTKTVNIVNTNHVLRSDGTAATKTQIQFCSKYYGKGIPSSLKLGVEYILDTKKLINPRMGFVDDENKNRKNATITLQHNEQVKCASPIDVYVRSDIRDKLTALVVEAKYWLQDDADLSPAYLQQLPRNPRSALVPVLDLNSPPSKKDSISIQKNCGDDNVCIPNLDVSVEPSVQEYYLDSGKKFFLDITVSNSGEDAFETTLEVKYPDGFYYSTSSDVQVVSHVLCSSYENNTIKCDIGNPVPFNKVVHFKVFFQPDYSKEFPAKLHFDVLVNSTNEELEETRANNKRRVSISILYDVIQDIRGWSIPGEVLFSPASTLYADDISNQTSRTPSKDRLSEDVIGPQVIHVYELKNGGKTVIKSTEIFFVWPATTLTGEDFLYLVDPPEFSFAKNLNLKCGPIPANYRDFELSPRRKSIWELYDINVQVDTSSEKSTSTSSKIGATIGGKIVKGDETLNKAVETSGDSSSVMDVRHQNKTQGQTIAWQDSTRVQIFEAGSDTSRKLGSGNFKHLQFGGKDYVYRCFRTVNGQEREVDCGADFSLTKSAPGLLQLASAQYQEEGNIQYWCLDQDSAGNWKKVGCQGVPKVPLITQTKDEGATTVQIFNGNQMFTNRLEEGKYKHQKVGTGDFVYRCFRRRNGREEEIECGKNFSFSSVDIPWVLEHSGVQQEGDIRYACLEPDSQGKLHRTDCQNVPKIRLKTEIIRTSWGQNDTHYWNDTGTYYVGPKMAFTKIQVFQGGEDIRQQLEGGIYRHQYIDGRDFIYRCFLSVNGREQEIDCGENFSLARLNIIGLLEKTGVQQDERIRFTCLEPDGNGNLRYVACGTVPAIRIRPLVITSSWESNGTHYWNNSGVYTLPQTYSFETVQVLLGGGNIMSQITGNYRLENVAGQEFLCRCFKSSQQVDCGSNFSLAGINVIVLMRRVGIQTEGPIRYFCLRTDSAGNWMGTDCGHLPKIQLVQQRQTYQTQQQILRRCLKLENGQWSEVDCRSDTRFQSGRGENTFVEQCFQTINGRRESINCSEVPAGAKFTDVYNQQSQSRGSDYYSGNTDYGQQSRTNTHQQQGGSQYGSQVYGRDYNYNAAGDNDRRNNHSVSYNENNYEEIYDDDYDNGKSITGYIDPHAASSREQQQGRRDPKTYGTYSESRNQGLGLDNSGVGGAARGSGFTTGVLDLGTLGGSQNNNGARVSESHWSETRQISPVYNNIGDNVPTAAPSGKKWNHGRRKRQIVGDNHPSIQKIKEKYPCHNLGCVYMRCTVENLEHGKPLTIALRGRLNAKVLRNMKLDNAMQFSSMMLARVQRVPRLMSVDDSKIEMQEVETVVKTPEEIKSETVPLWVVVLSAVAGTIILLLLIFLLYKLGFFKRNRPSSAPERQPLNRNGYHHGDEAL